MTTSQFTAAELWIYDQSYELFYSIRDLLPERRRHGEDLSFRKKIAWNFKQSKVELLVGEIDYAKGTVPLLVDVMYAGKTIRTYEIRKDRSEASAEVIKTQCPKAQTSMVKQTKAREELPHLQAAVDGDDVPITRVNRLSLERLCSRSQGLALASRQENEVTRFQTSVQASLRSIDDPGERRAVVLHHSLNWLRDLLDEWTTLNDRYITNSVHLDSPERTTPSESSLAATQAPTERPIRMSSSGSREAGKASSSPFGFTMQDLPGRLEQHFVESLNWTETVFKNLPATKIPHLDGSKRSKRATIFPSADDFRTLGNSHGWSTMLRLNFPGGFRFQYHVHSGRGPLSVRCEWDEEGRNTRQRAGAYLRDLEPRRKDNCLELYRTQDDPLNGGATKAIWAKLYFETLEFLLTFRLTMLALRASEFHSYDFRSKTVEGWKTGEIQLFAAPIYEHESYHALRVYQDCQMKAVRFEASVLSGEKKGPVWTAWLDASHLPGPCTPATDGNPTISLDGIQQHVLSSQYLPRRHERYGDPGWPILIEFIMSKDATEFEKIIENLRDGTRPLPSRPGDD